MASITKSIKRKITDFCSPYELIQILFINQSGGNDFWYFNMDSKRTVEVTRNEFTKVLDPEYTMGNRGRTVYSTTAKDTWKINTNWISEYDWSYLEQLILSPEVYWIKNDLLYPIVITNKNYEIKTMLRDKLFQLSLEFEMAFDKNVITQ